MKIETSNQPPLFNLDDLQFQKPEEEKAETVMPKVLPEELRMPVYTKEELDELFRERPGEYWNR